MIKRLRIYLENGFLLKLILKICFYFLIAKWLIVYSLAD